MAFLILDPRSAHVNLGQRPQEGEHGARSAQLVGTGMTATSSVFLAHQVQSRWVSNQSHDLIASAMQENTVISRPLPVNASNALIQVIPQLHPLNYCSASVWRVLRVLTVVLVVHVQEANIR